MYIRKNFSYLSLIAFFLFACEKEEAEVSGCMDLNASNYDADATVDCCCSYDNTVDYVSEFTPESGADSSETDLESPAYFKLMTATSTNGIDWIATGETICDQGNVPDMIEFNNALFLYYTGYNVGELTNTTVVAISEDHGTSWAFKHIHLQGYQSGDLVTNGDPDVILTAEGNVRMFITTMHQGTKSVLCFESTDGLNFDFVDVAAHDDNDDVFDSNTFFFNGEWHMYCINSVNTTHWYLKSTDGVHFNIDSTYDFDESGNQHFISNGFIDGDTYRIFSAFIPNNDLHQFESLDGINWTHSGEVLSYGTVSGEGSYLKDPAIIQLEDGTWFMVYVTRIP